MPTRLLDKHKHSLLIIDIISINMFALTINFKNKIKNVEKALIMLLQHKA